MAGQGSARVSLREIDLSASKPVKRVLTGTPAGVVGRAKRGPAFVPTFFADMNEFEEKFGSLSDKGLDSNSNLYGPLAVSEWMSGNPGSGAFVRVLGIGSGSSNESGAGFTVGEKQLDSNGSFVNNTFVNDTNSLGNGGRTYFLGHISEDKTGSKYLDDVGLNTLATQSSIRIVLSGSTTSTAIPTADSYMQFNISTTNGIDNIVNIGFKSGGGELKIDGLTIDAVNVINITASNTHLLLLNALKTKLTILYLNDLVANDLTVTDVSGDGKIVSLEIKPKKTGTVSHKVNKYRWRLSSVNQKAISIFSPSNATTTTKNGNVAQTLNLKGAVGKDAVIKVIFNGNVTQGDTISLYDVNANTPREVTFTFLNDVTAIQEVDTLKPVKIGLTADDTLNNFENKLIDLNYDDLYDLTIDYDLNYIQLVAKDVNLTGNNLNNQKSIKFNMISDISLGLGYKENGTVTIASDDIVEGSDGQQSVAFAGATDKGAKVIRGVLMTPQGVTAKIKNVAGNFDTTGKIDNESFVLSLDNFIIGTVNSSILSCSFNPDESNYFGKILNTNPHMIKEKGHYLYASYDISTDIVGTVVGDNTSNHGFCIPTSQNRNVGTEKIPNFEKFVKRFKTAHSPWVVSQAFGINEDGSDNVGLGDKVVKLFRFHALDDGEIGNNQIKITISNLTKGQLGSWGTFDLAIEKLTSNPVKGGNILIQWKRLTLDASSPNYIARVIGDKNIRYNFDIDDIKQGLVEEGTYEVKNPYVRLELSEDLESGNLSSEALPAGFGGMYELNTFSDISIFAGTNIDGARVLPIPMLRSIGKGEALSGREVGAVLPWGIKFANKKNLDSKHEEYSEQSFNSSLVNYSKYFATSDGTNAPAWKQPIDVNGNLDLSNDLNFFHLEKIKITKKSSIDEADPKKWGDAIFFRSDSASDNTEGTRRFLRLKKDLNLLNTKYMSFSFIMQGGFDGLNIFDETQHKFKDSACVKEAKSAAKTGATVITYQKAIDSFSDKSVSNIQLLVTPGVREKLVTDYAIKQAEERFDTMYLMDIGEYDDNGAIIIDEDVKPSVENTINEFEARQLDTSFAAAYFPDIVLNKSTGGSIKVPPTVGMLGVISRMDLNQRPWYAPAGITSGRVNANGVAFSINRDQLNELYDADINPIYIPSGRSNVHAFGQKTLLKDPSALDRINVRRLLIYVRREVKNIANRFLFEPNRQQTLRNFAAAVEPILQRVQNEGGVERYKVQIDSSTTTQNDVENNIIRGKIYLQPTKSIEFISLDFEVRNSID